MSAMKKPLKFSLFPGREPGQSIELSSISSQWYYRLQLVEKNIESAMLYNRELDENALARERIEKDLVKERATKEQAQNALAKLEVNYCKLLTDFETLKKESLSELTHFAEQSAKTEQHEHDMELELTRAVQETKTLREASARIQDEQYKRITDMEMSNTDLSRQHDSLKKEIELLRTQLEHKAAALMEACLSSQIAPEPAAEFTDETEPEPVLTEPDINDLNIPVTDGAVNESEAEPISSVPAAESPQAEEQPQSGGLMTGFLKWWTQPAFVVTLPDLKFSKEKDPAPEPENNSQAQ